MSARAKRAKLSEVVPVHVNTAGIADSHTAFAGASALSGAPIELRGRRITGIAQPDTAAVGEIGTQ